MLELLLLLLLLRLLLVLLPVPLLLLLLLRLELELELVFERIMTIGLNSSRFMVVCLRLLLRRLLLLSKPE
jgi:hypothetical protein